MYKPELGDIVLVEMKVVGKRLDFEGNVEYKVETSGKAGKGGLIFRDFCHVTDESIFPMKVEEV